MATEIERKFLINPARWEAAEKPEGLQMEQAYLLHEAGCTIRIRIAGSAAWITLKGSTTGISRAEFEYPLPVDDAREMLKIFPIAGMVLRKTRYAFTVGEQLWEADIFEGENKGLMVAEIELDHPEQAIMLPAWIEKEVSDDPRYFNSNLAIHPYRSW